MQISASQTFTAPVQKQAPKAVAAKSVKAAQKFQKKTVSIGNKNTAMQIWQPYGNKMFETFSYLPPLSADQIARQVDYIIGNNWTPCLEFADPESAYVKDIFPQRFCGTSSTYQDNRYWTMWKLPMFGCNDPAQVLREIDSAADAFPNAYVRLLAFDANRQVQILSFLVHRPPNEQNFTPIEKRSLAVK